jgi:hypothetical protein
MSVKHVTISGTPEVRIADIKTVLRSSPSYFRALRRKALSTAVLERIRAEQAFDERATARTWRRLVSARHKVLKVERAQRSASLATTPKPVPADEAAR